MSLFEAAFATSNKGTAILYRFMSQVKEVSPTENSKIQVLFKAFERFSSTFQGRLYFPGLFTKDIYIQGLFKKDIYIQVLFKPVQTLYMKLKDF